MLSFSRSCRLSRSVLASDKNSSRSTGGSAHFIHCINPNYWHPKPRKNYFLLNGTSNPWFHTRLCILIRICRNMTCRERLDIIMKIDDCTTKSNALISILYTVSCQFLHTNPVWWESEVISHLVQRRWRSKDLSRYKVYRDRSACWLGSDFIVLVTVKTWKSATLGSWDVQASFLFEALWSSPFLRCFNHCLCITLFDCLMFIFFCLSGLDKTAYHHFSHLAEGCSFVSVTRYLWQLFQTTVDLVPTAH